MQIKNRKENFDFFGHNVQPVVKSERFIGEHGDIMKWVFSERSFRRSTGHARTREGRLKWDMKITIPWRKLLIINRMYFFNGMVVL